ncbi:unnamed protein product [Linum trigynum]|uniref:Uncharacterized protein n=1 Tax=Linum trigynum TaxID=586398 RepID=A0AAV2FCR5_9ROSI
MLSTNRGGNPALTPTLLPSDRLPDPSGPSTIADLLLLMMDMASVISSVMIIDSSFVSVHQQVNQNLVVIKQPAQATVKGHLNISSLMLRRSQV